MKENRRPMELGQGIALGCVQLVTATMVACYSPTYSEEPFRCGVDRSCPEGFYCYSSVCRRSARDAAPGRDADRGPSTSKSDARDAPAPKTVTIINPVLKGMSDPHVLRQTGSDGKAFYYLTVTAGTGDIKIYTSRDLAVWTLAPEGLFRRTAAAGASLEINGNHYCSIWSPQIVELGPASYLLAFAASRFTSARSPCPVYGEDGGIYLATATSPLGPFAEATRPTEPSPAGAKPDCAGREAIPHSVETVTAGCTPSSCRNSTRLDSDVFLDSRTGRAWLAYAWFTNSVPKDSWEKTNLGVHVSIVELDAKDPLHVKCDAQVPVIYAANPHDAATLTALETSCTRCGEMLSMTRGRNNEEIKHEDNVWGVAEAPTLFRHGDYVYLLVSGSAWDSAYAHVYWVAAKTVEELAVGSSTRSVGRYLIPSQGRSFNHGSVVLGPDGVSLYFVHDGLLQEPCKTKNECNRDLWVSPLEVGAGIGLGKNAIKPRFPAEEPTTAVLVP